MHFLRKIAFVAFLTTFAFIQADVEEVIVTANKKVETVQEIPMNISVITDVDIEERGITTPEDFLRTLAGVTTPGGSRYYSFRGLNTSGFDKYGNYTFGVKEHIIFPEVNFDKVDKIRGLDITIVIKSQKVEHSFELLKHLNFPFRERRSN